MNETVKLFPNMAPEERSSLLFAMRLQEIESNPLDAEQIAMFEMFDRDGLTDEQCRAHLINRAMQSAAD